MTTSLYNVPEIWGSITPVMIWYKFVFLCIQNLLKPVLEGWECQNADNINRGIGMNYYIGRWGSSFL